MADNISPSAPTPERSQPIPDSYAIFVTETALHIWQYRHSISEPEGEWEFVETIAQADEPQLSLTQASLTPPDDEGYWVYAIEYDCSLGCD